MNPKQAEARSSLLLRSYRKSYPVAVRGQGVYLWDKAGKKYIDFASSAVVNFIGHGVREIGEAMAEQARALEFVHSSQFTTEVSERFAQELLDFLGPAYRDASVFFTSGGSEAVETALKLARQYQVEIGRTSRFEIVSRKQSYHGATLGAMAVSGNRKRKEIYTPMLREFRQVRIPYCYRCEYRCDDGCINCGREYANELETILTAHDHDIAAFIYEPVSGATLGAVAPPNGYLKRIHEICAGHGVLTIADEVMTGIGRTGQPLAVLHWDVTPDIVVLAKGLSSGYAPLGAVVASRKVVDAIANGSGALVHGFTYNAHPPSMAAGRAVLKIIRDGDLVRAADDSGSGAAAHLKKAMERLREFECIGDIRGIGLLRAIEFVKDKASKEPFPAEANFAGKVAQACMERGVAVYPMQGCVDGYGGDHVMIAPPAVIGAGDIEVAIDAVASAVSSLAVRR